MTASWDVVATVRERPEVLEVFVGHHLAAGCRCVHLYFDDPDDPLIGRWRTVPGVRAQPSTLPRQRPDGRPVSHNARQSANATHALRRSTADWIAHIDADELLYAGAGVGAALQGLDPSVFHLRVLSHEAVFETWAAAQLPFNARHFRRGEVGDAGWRQIRALYSDDARAMLQRGMCGHSVGKCLLRRGRVAAQGGIHFWRDTVGGDWLPATTVEDGSFVLLHFDAISFPIWKEKLAKRVAREVHMSGRAAHRQRQVERFAHLQGDEAALQALFCSLYVLDDAARQLLRRDRSLLDIALDVVFPGTSA